MSASRPTRNRRRSIDRAYRRAIADGPLWGFRSGVRSPQPDLLGSIAEQHWDPMLEARPGAELALATSLRSLRSVGALPPSIEQVIDDAAQMASFVGRSPVRRRDTDALLVDGRCLQHPDFAQRGIGRLARSVIEALVTAVPQLDIVVVSDADLPHLDAASFPPSVRLASGYDSGDVAVLDPAPMTHRPSSLDRFAEAGEVTRIAVVHDYVPAHAPDIYLPTSIDRVDYLVRLGRLRGHDQLWCNSGSIAEESTQILGPGPRQVAVLPPPPSPVVGERTRPETVVGPFVFAPVGADRRKNLPAAVSALAHLALGGWSANLVILSHMPDPHRLELDQLAEVSGVDHDRIIVVSALSDQELAWLYDHAEVALVPSYDEGLSLPVLEAVDAGCPVVASDIPPHRELLGPNEPLCDPRSPREMADRLRAVLTDRATTLSRQRSAVAAARTRRSFDDVVDLLRIR